MLNRHTASHKEIKKICPRSPFVVYCNMNLQEARTLRDNYLFLIGQPAIADMDIKITDVIVCPIDNIQKFLDLYLDSLHFAHKANDELLSQFNSKDYVVRVVTDADPSFVVAAWDDIDSYKDRKS